MAPGEYCTKQAWCACRVGHQGNCLGFGKRGPHERSEWDTRTPDPKGWREVRSKS